MILSGKEIAKQVQQGRIMIDDFDPKKVNPNSYNLKLDDKLLVYTSAPLDMKRNNPYKEIIIPEKEGLVLTPGVLYLGKTKERTFTHSYVPMLEGRSSVGRLGVYIHVTAGFGDVGFNGFWTLEISCIQPVRIYAGVDICQIYYHTIEGDFDLYKSNKYQHNFDVQPSMLYKDFE